MIKPKNCTLLCMSFLLVLSINSAFCQGTTTISLNKVVYEKFYSEKVLEALRSRGLPVNNPGFIAGDYQDESIAFRIALNSVDNDIYNEIGKDDIMLGRYQADSIYTQPYPLKKNMVLGNEAKAFKIVEIDPLGNYIQIQPTDYTHPLDIRLFDRLPNQIFELIGGEKKNLRDFQNQEKYIYVEIWGMWCGPCLDSIDELREVSKKYGDRLTIIYLNYRDSDKRKVEAYLEGLELEWIFGYSNESINESLNMGGLPHGILFDNYGKLIEERLHPMSLMNYLNSLQSRGLWHIDH